jgi:hypothetical protein
MSIQTATIRKPDNAKWLGRGCVSSSNGDILGIVIAVSSVPVWTFYLRQNDFYAIIINNSEETRCDGETLLLLSHAFHKADVSNLINWWTHETSLYVMDVSHGTSIAILYDQQPMRLLFRNMKQLAEHCTLMMAVTTSQNL